MVDSLLSPIPFESSVSQSVSKRVVEGYELKDLRGKFPSHSNLYDPALMVLEFSNCFVDRNGFISLPTGEFIFDVGYRERIRTSIDLHTGVAERGGVPRIKEPIILVGGDNNYYHWHLNWMPRIFIADRFPELHECKILMNSNPSKFIWESLAANTGRSLDSAFLMAEPIYQIDRLFVPTMFLNPMHSPFVLEKYRELGQRARNRRSTERLSKIFISRRSAKFRKIVNEEEVSKYLESKGFIALESEKLSYEKQVEIFSNARTVVAAHGAGLTNILFMQPGFGVVEIFNSYYSKVYWSLALALGGRHYKTLKHGSRFDDSLASLSHKQIKDEDIHVDLDRLQAEVESFIE